MLFVSSGTGRFRFAIIANWRSLWSAQSWKLVIKFDFDTTLDFLSLLRFRDKRILSKWRPKIFQALLEPQYDVITEKFILDVLVRITIRDHFKEISEKWNTLLNNILQLLKDMLQKRLEQLWSKAIARCAITSASRKPQKSSLLVSVPLFLLWVEDLLLLCNYLTESSEFTLRISCVLRWFCYDVHWTVLRIEKI